FASTFVASPSEANAQGNVLTRLFSRKKEDLTIEQLMLKPEHGPWMILAIVLEGDNAAARATMLANEIRHEFKTPAFVWKKNFDNTGALGAVTQEFNNLDGTKTIYKAQTHYRNASRKNVYAVLVGDFADLNDPRADEMLQRIRRASPQTLINANAENAVQKSRAMLWARTEQANMDKASANNRRLTQYKDKGTMGAASLTKNPLLPFDFLHSNTMDDFVVKMNKQVEHSILDNKGRFTTRVASFTGYSSTTLIKHKNPVTTASATDVLDHSALQADRLTKALRKKGVEAYQYHDRFGSYVMIGSFDELGKQDANGGFQYNPEMEAVLKHWCGYRDVTAKDRITGAVSHTQSVNSLNKIPFDIEGKHMAVPKPESKGFYRPASFFGR
ncbi:MAG: hypothetical protein AAF394_15375, partial [Planctomycetota bacterium]